MSIAQFMSCMTKINRSTSWIKLRVTVLTDDECACIVALPQSHHACHVTYHFTKTAIALFVFSHEHTSTACRLKGGCMVASVI